MLRGRFSIKSWAKSLRSPPPLPADMSPQAWKALALCAGKMVEMFKPIAFVENKDTDTQVRSNACRWLRRPACGAHLTLWLVGGAGAAHAAAAVAFFDLHCTGRMCMTLLPGPMWRFSFLCRCGCMPVRSCRRWWLPSEAQNRQAYRCCCCRLS